MRPRPEGRGERCTHFSNENYSGRASMRPRPEGRGERSSTAPVFAASPASMRPRPEGRGEQDFAHVPDPDSPCFNAATTRRPWRTAAQGRRGHAARPASMRPRPEGRGEPRGQPPRGQPRRGASMRPRPEGRGERGSSRPGPGPTRRFNAATTRRPWRTTDGELMHLIQHALQCGHDPKAVENKTTSSASNGWATASMRPRPEGRGEPVHAVRADQAVAVASMRPRPEGRGELVGLAAGLHGLGASMRPRPEGRGEPVRGRHDGRDAGFASMRPRPEGRGEPRMRLPALFGLVAASMRPRPEGRGELRP